MPIYAYKCATCGHAQDVLQKISDAPLTVCPACGAATYTKQVTAAGFQLKGSGWYVTDFRDNGSKKKDAAKDSKAETKSDTAPTGAPAGDSKPADASPKSEAAAPAPSPSSPSPAPAPSPSPSPTPSSGSSGGN